MRRAVFVLLFLLVSAKYGLAQPACTVTVNPDQPTVAAAVATALAGADGQVICLNAGSVTYTDQVTIGDGSKCVEIRGAGSLPSQGSAGSTIINVNVAGHDAFSGWEAPNSSCTIDNIRFTFNETDAAPFALISFSNAFGNGKPWIIHHNDFNITGRCDQPKMVDAATHGGVIYRNKFTAEIIGAPTDPTGCKGQNTNINAVTAEITDDGTWWSTASTMGTLDTTGYNNVYVENNYFENLNVAIDANTSSRIVWRFNTMRNASTVDHGYDSSVTGVRHGEIYDNTWLCNEALSQGAYIAMRGGVYYVFSNTFPVRDPLACGISSTTSAALRVSYFKAIQCDFIGGWPGSYSGTYPAAHEPGWGWITGATTVGSSTMQGQPGGAGFTQDLQPHYYFANTNNSGNDLLSRDTGYIGTCRAMAYSNTGKSSGTTLVIPNGSAQANPYVNVGQEAVVVFSDLVGGSTPTITSPDNLGNTWAALTGGTNGSQRLTAWHSHITNAGAIVVTVNFGSSAAARAGTLIVMRGMTASPVDVNPAVVTANPSAFAVSVTTGGSGYSSSVGNCSNASATTGGSGTGLTVDIVASGAITSASTCAVGSGYAVGDVVTVSGGGGNSTLTLGAAKYLGPSSGTLAQTNEIVLGYFALNGPTIWNTGDRLTETDLIQATAPDIMSMSCLPCTSNYNVGFVGTSGSTDTTNTIVGVTYRSVSATTAVQPQITDTTANRNGITGTVAFKVTSNDNNNLDLQVTDLVQLDREVYTEATMFNGTSGTGYGIRTDRPASTTNGVAWWDTDHGGHWNKTSGNLNDGCLDIVVSGTWSNCVYTPADYPQTLATVTGGGACTPDHLAWIAQPSDAVLGASLGTVSVGVYDISNNLCSSDSSTSITLSKDGSATWGTLVSGSSLTKTDSSGVATWTDLSVTTTTGTGAIQSAASGLAGAGSVDITISAAPPAGTGGGLKLKLRLKGFVN